MGNPLRGFNHIDAMSIDEAIAVLKQGDAWACAGGTDLLGTMKFYILRDYPKTVVNIKTIKPSMNYIKEEGGVLKIGAVTKLEDIAKNDTIKVKWSALAEAAHKTASTHLREMGTIGGNICQLNRCWYFRKEDNRFDCIRKGGNTCYAIAGDNRYHSIFGAVAGCVAVNPSDIAPALVALDATIITNKRSIPVEDFWAVKIPGSTVLESDEIVIEIQIPAFSGASAFVKFALRSSIDFPIVNCAAAIDGSNARICLNAVHSNPYRALAAEEVVSGNAINTQIIDSASEAAVSGAIALPMNKYKIQIAKGMVKKAILACT